MVHTAIKVRADLKKKPCHTDLWQGIDQAHVERIIPENLFLILSLLCGGMDIFEGARGSPLEDRDAKRSHLLGFLKARYAIPVHTSIYQGRNHRAL